MDIKLAVISDLHVGLGARSKDLCPEPLPANKKEVRRYSTKTDVAYRDTFVAFVKAKDIHADYLLLPGDITHTARPEEVKLASEFVLQAAEALGVPHTNIVFVPGNHDVDWTAYDPRDTTGLVWARRYDWIGAKEFEFRSIIKTGKGDVLAPPHFSIWQYDNLCVVGYNSASHDKPVIKDAAHHGLAEPAHLEELRKFLAGLGKPDGRVRLFLVHHHAIDFTNPLPRTPDFSLMSNAEELLKLCHECSFDILIHGHKHHPRFETHSTPTYPHLPILCSGSFSVEIDTEWAGTIDNQFHLVKIEGRAGTEKGIKGKVISWTNNRARGWRESEESTSGIHHIIPFGSYVMPVALDARIEPFIREWFTKHDCILWRDIIAQFSDLEHLPLDSAIAAFKRMESRFGRQSMYQTRKELILY